VFLLKARLNEVVPRSQEKERLDQEEASRPEPEHDTTTTTVTAIIGRLLSFGRATQLWQRRTITSLPTRNNGRLRLLLSYVEGAIRSSVCEYHRNDRSLCSRWSTRLGITFRHDT